MIDDQFHRIHRSRTKTICAVWEASQVRSLPSRHFRKLTDRPSVMELGGKSPALVLPGADVKIAANNVSTLAVGADDRSYSVLSSTPDRFVCRLNELSSMSPLRPNSRGH